MTIGTDNKQIKTKGEKNSKLTKEQANVNAGRPHKIRRRNENNEVIFIKNNRIKFTVNQNKNYEFFFFFNVLRLVTSNAYTYQMSMRKDR